MWPRKLRSSWKILGRLIINSQMLSALPVITLMMVRYIFWRVLGFKDDKAFPVLDASIYH